MPISPTASSISASDTWAANSQAAPTPTTAPGMSTLRFQALHCRRNTHTDIASWHRMMGKSIAAACNGGKTRASSGVATMPMPAKPPLLSPRKITAGMASR